MKKSLLALAVLGAFAGVASAQSSVTLYGTVDLNGRYVKADGQDKRLTLSQDGINSSQLGFRGVEDLGGGLKAGFNLLAGVNADTGTTNSKFFNRRSTVSLFSNLGEAAPRPRLHADVLEPDDLRRVRHERPRQLAQRPQRLRRHPSRQHHRLLPAGQPGRLLRPGHGGLFRRRHVGRPSGALLRRPCRLRRGSVRRRRRLFGSEVPRRVSLVSPGGGAGLVIPAGEPRRPGTSAARGTSAS